MKKMVIRWALKQLRSIIKNKNISYEELKNYGVKDVIKLELTGEDAIIL